MFVQSCNLKDQHWKTMQLVEPQTMQMAYHGFRLLRWWIWFKECPWLNPCRCGLFALPRSAWYFHKGDRCLLKPITTCGYRELQNQTSPHIRFKLNSLCRCNSFSFSKDERIFKIFNILPLFCDISFFLFRGAEQRIRHGFVCVC